MKNIIYKIYTLLKFYSQISQYNFIGFKEINVSKTNKHNSILFCPFAPHKINIFREAVFAYACKLRGAQPSFLTCDLNFKYVDFLNPQTKKDLSVTYWITKKMYKRIGLPLHNLSRYSSSEDLSFIEKVKVEEIENYTYKGIYIGDLVVASTIRYFYCNGPEYDNPEFAKALRGFFKTAVILIDTYEELLDKVKPDKLVMSHGIYVAWGTLFRLAQTKNIPVDCYGASYRKNTLRFYHNAPNAPFPLADWPEFKEKPLSNTELETVNKYFASRATQAEDSVKLFQDSDTLPENVNQFLKMAKDKNHKIFCLFTNISWDAYMFNNGGAFESMHQWLEQTIEFFRNKEGVSLIIKGHPAEEYWKVPDKYRVKHFIPKDLPDTFLFIDELTKVKPFDLYDFIDYGLIYISTVCLEMAMLEIPVITAGVGGHYEGKGFTIDPTSKEDYFSKIDNGIQGNLTYNFDKEQAQRYLYFRFYREAIHFDVVLPSTDVKKSIEPDILEEGKNQSIDIVCNGILNDAKFYN